MNVRQLRGYLVRFFGSSFARGASANSPKNWKAIWRCTSKTTCAPVCRRKKRGVWRSSNSAV